MTAAGQPPVAIANFIHYYQQLREGRRGEISEADIHSIDSLPDMERLDPGLADLGRRERAKTVIIKLNGGLGTSMGLEGAKSLIVVKDGLTFLDIIARQALGQGTPLILMNSNATREDSLPVLRRYPALQRNDIGLDFLQHSVPKIDRRSLLPVSHPAAPQFEWCPPGHGDLYAALVTSGLLNRLLNAGYRSAFISNADNLGAMLDETVLGYFVSQACPFLMEAADRTPGDRKGGHLARNASGALILREFAQCRADDRQAFLDIVKHKYFNTNNLWLDLQTLRATLDNRGYILRLPLICNPKHVDPRDADSTPVYQLESAMGAAISVFEGAQALRVPRRRFIPVKTTNDLFVIRSDAYTLSENYQLVPSRSGGEQLPRVNLDPRYYQSMDAYEQRLPFGVPSLSRCRSLVIQGDVKFGQNITLEGDVTITNQTGKQVMLDDAAVLTGEINF
jgi:UTP--glucose-1-phosphate uridylyltransferase